LSPDFYIKYVIPVVSHSGAFSGSSVTALKLFVDMRVSSWESFNL
jgi:hypothetical protein